jgi:RNA polymerase sigma factor (sigma-70 family)
MPVSEPCNTYAVDEPSDAELLARLRDDPESLALFYRRHVVAVERYAVRRCAQPDDVADLVSATFLSVLDTAPAFDERRGPALPWLLGVAHHLLARSFFESERQDMLAARIGGQRKVDGEDFARLEEAIDAAKDLKAVEGALAGMSFAEREVIWLTSRDALSTEEAAQVLGVSLATFRVRLHRARRTLRRALKGHPRTHHMVAFTSQEEPSP